MPKKKKSKTSVTPQPAQRQRRPNLWASIVFPFLLFAFVFGGTDAILLQDTWSFGIALFLIASLNCGVFFKSLSRFRQSLLSALLILVGFAVVLFMIPPVRIAKQTTFLTEPKTQDGTKINYAKVISEQVSREKLMNENGFRNVAGAFGPAILNTEQNRSEYWEKLCALLKIDSKQKPTQPCQSAESFFSQRKGQIASGSPIRLLEQLRENSWKSDEFPIAQDWLAQNDAAFDLLAEAVKQENFTAPVFWSESLAERDAAPKLEYFLSSIGRDLRIRIQNAIGNGQPEKAWADVLTQFRLARHLFQQAFEPTTFFNAQILWADAVQSAIITCQNSDYSAEELESKLGELENFLQPFSKEIGKSIVDTERLLALERMQATAWGENSNFESALFRRFFRFFHWNETLTKINAYFDWIEILESPNYTLASSFPIRENASEWSQIIKCGLFRAVPDKRGLMEIKLWNDRAHQLEQQLKTLQARTALLRSAVYLEMYRIEHDGKYPAIWAELKAVYGDKIPDDPCRPLCSSTRSLNYVPLEEGTGYKLYSVGPNGIDENGTSWKENRKSDDIAVSGTQLSNYK